MGEWSAVRPKSGKSVRQSDPGLRRPTPPVTAGRKLAARPPVLPALATISLSTPLPCAGDHPQPKTGRGAGRSPAGQSQRAALGSSNRTTHTEQPLACSLDDSQVAALLEFFKTLDRWDRESCSPGSTTLEVTL